MAYKNPVPSIDSNTSNLNDCGISTCECCGKENVLVMSTSFTDIYCKECLKLVIYECKKAIKEIDSYGKPNKVKRVSTKQRITKEEFAELERQKDEALANLMNFNVKKK